jgi:oxygen-independent coproporphyrinogen-3 oxidase
MALAPSYDVAPELVEKYNRPGPRYTSYPPVPNWTAPFGEADYRAALRDAATDTGDIALYVHIPFCAQRCLYCGCNVTVTRRAARVDEYLDRLERELRGVIESLGTGRRVTQLHLGGGTPNVLTPAQGDRLTRLLEDNFAFADDAERSIEADPRLVTAEQLQHLHQLGFRRLSYGVQDLDEDVQIAIGRVQPAEVVAAAVDAARAAGFTGLNVDLIYGLPRQTPDSFERTLDEVLAWRPERIACFGYAHVPWMRKHQRAIQEGDLPGGFERFALFRMAVERTAALGYEWIGYDHFSVPEDPLSTAHKRGALHRNFMGYTTMPAAHLLGLGMSAIGEVAGRYVQMAGEGPQYDAGIDAGTLPVVRGHVLSDEDRAQRAMILQLMCNLRLPFEAITGDRDAVLARLAPLAADGFVDLTQGAIQVTDIGRFFLRNICMEFDTYLGRGATGPRYSRTV